jgi:hypothetical protein
MAGIPFLWNFCPLQLGQIAACLGASSPYWMEDPIKADSVATQLNIARNLMPLRPVKPHAYALGFRDLPEARARTSRRMPLRGGPCEAKKENSNDGRSC